MNIKKLMALLSAISLITGCASIGQMNQSLPFACNTPTCEIQIKGEENTNVIGPSVHSISRQKSIEVRYKYKNQTQTKKVNGEVRWTEGVLGNGMLIFLGGPALALIGMGIDYYNGSLFELPAPPVAVFQEKSALKIKPKKIVITPVSADKAVHSEEAVYYLKKELTKSFPDSEILVPELFINEFEKVNWSYDSIPKDNDEFYKLIGDLKTPYIVQSELRVGEDGKTKLFYTVNDVE